MDETAVARRAALGDAAAFDCLVRQHQSRLRGFLLRVTGIPLTEELSVKSKGDAYREYQRTTSAFVPWFKKKAKLQTA